MASIIDMNLIPDQAGGRVDFFNDMGVDISAGQFIVADNIKGYCGTDVADDAIGSIVFTGVEAVFTGLLDSGAADDYAVGALIEYNETTDVFVPAGSSQTAVPFVCLPKCDPVHGAGLSSGINSADGAAAAGDTYIRLGLLGRSEVAAS